MRPMAMIGHVELFATHQGNRLSNALGFIDLGGPPFASLLAVVS